MSIAATVTKSAKTLPRLTYTKIIVGRLPYIAGCAASLGFFFAWPHTYGLVNDKINKVPRINRNII